MHKKFWAKLWVIILHDANILDYFKCLIYNKNLKFYKPSACVFL
jgi:hypothetical protein